MYVLPGIFPLVPGAGIYYTAYYLFIGNTEMSGFKGLETLEIAGAIVFGIIFGFGIPQWIFHKLFPQKMDMNEEKYFLEECADALCDNDYAEADLAIMLLNLDYYDRGVCIQGYGLCESRVNDDRIEYILDDIIECFSEDDYVYGVKLFATEAAYYAGSTNYSKYFKDNSFEGKIKRMPWGLVVLVPAGIAAIGVLCMKGSNGGRMTTNGKTYIQNDASCLTAKKDDYVRTSVTKTYSPRSSGSSGGSRSSGGRSSGGGGRSSGGRSHSGGSRRF
jgi:uncharacterized protein